MLRQLCELHAAAHELGAQMALLRRRSVDGHGIRCPPPLHLDTDQSGVATALVGERVLPSLEKDRKYITTFKTYNIIPYLLSHTEEPLRTVSSPTLSEL